MNRWAARIVGVIILLIFTLVFVQMYKTLVRLQQQQVGKSSSLRGDVLKTRRLDDFKLS